MFRNKKKILVLAIDTVFFGLCVFSKWLSQLMIDGLGGCRFYEIYGIKCLTCGGTRCVNALSQGRILEAFSYNAFVPVALVLLAFSLVLLNVAWLFGNKKAGEVLSRLCNLKLLFAGCIITALYVLCRNILPVIYRL